MAFWKNLFRRVKREAPDSEDLDQLVYARDEVNFYDDEERTRYITSCLEQIAEASKEEELLKGEYSLVTAYLTDMEEIEALPAEDRQQINDIAHRLDVLENERNRYRDRKNPMDDAEYMRIRKQETEIEEGISKLKEEEHYAELVKQDLRRLNGERHAYEYRRGELDAHKANLRGMAIIFLVALGMCILLLAILQFGFQMDTYIGDLIAVMAAAIAITVLCVKYIDADKEQTSVELSINKLIQLQNKVKIRYVNNKNLLDYLHIKYQTDSASKLEKQWERYLQEKEERKQFVEIEQKADYYRERLVELLTTYRVKDPIRWVRQTGALLDPREMVEIRHELILRRQALRKQLDYNQDVAKTARVEVMDVAHEYPVFAQEILDMVEQYDRAEY
ncbi:MAG: hypothetical protein K6G30_15800 [Acetatifactor sp.]|nr:hypothetical protein [Acetatifactor sp.]